MLNIIKSDVNEISQAKNHLLYLQLFIKQIKFSRLKITPNIVITNKIRIEYFINEKKSGTPNSNFILLLYKFIYFYEIVENFIFNLDLNILNH